MNDTFFVAGGDARQQAIARLLEKRGCAVDTFGLAPKDRLTPELAARLGAADVVLLPLPAADGNCLNAPSMEKKIPMEMLWSLLHPGQKLFGGMLSEPLLRGAAEYGLKPVDYFKREEFVLRNAYITAEGALELTLRELPRTVRGTRCMVLGYGRIGTFLARLLCALGAQVTVAARKGEDLVRAQLQGCETCAIARMKERLPACDVVYNTIPHLVLDRNALQKLPHHCFCMDLASRPGGVDFGAAQSLGIKTLWALGLPGKMAPESAGAAVLDTVFQILAEQEVPA